MTTIQQRTRLRKYNSVWFGLNLYICIIKNFMRLKVVCRMSSATILCFVSLRQRRPTSVFTDPTYQYRVFNACPHIFTFYLLFLLLLFSHVYTFSYIPIYSYFLRVLVSFLQFLRRTKSSTSSETKFCFFRSRYYCLRQNYFRLHAVILYILFASFFICFERNSEFDFSISP